MDNIETLSDCSESSKSSECLSSNVSTLSGLSEYQGEFLELRQLINPRDNIKESRGASTASANIISWCERQINDLNARLQQSLDQNEKYKKEIYDFQTKNDFLREAKIEKLLKQNQKLEVNLSAANSQIQRLISIHNKSDSGAETAFLTENILQLEKVNNELMNQNYLLSTKINHCNFQKNEIENESKKIKSDFNEMKFEFEAKTNVINGLKKKISEQHIEFQNLCQRNVKLSHSLEVLSNELEFVKKSETWYKGELHQSQQEKSKLCEQILENEKLISIQEKKVESLKLELSNLKCSNEEIFLVALREKEKILNQLELLENTAKNEHDVSNLDVAADVGSITKYYDSVINDLTNEVVKIKSDFEYQQKCVHIISKEKSEAEGKYLLMQNCLKDKDNLIRKLENNTKDLKEKLTSAINLQAQLSSEMLSLKKTCVVLKNQVDWENKEKESLEKSVNTVKEQLKTFLSNYVNLKSEVHKKYKEISQLQFEKEELHLNNNHTINELKRNLERGALELEMMRQKVSHLETVNESLKSENLTQTKTLESLNCELVKIRTDFDEFQNSYASNENGALVQKAIDVKISRRSPEPSLNENLDFQILNTPNVVDVLKYVIYMCKLEADDDENFNANDGFVKAIENNSSIRLLVNKIQTHLQSAQTEVISKTKDLLQLKKIVKTLKNTVLHRVVQLMDKCKLLEMRNEENTQMLKLLFDERHKSYNSSDEVQSLQTQLQVKILEAQYKQKRYERNYRTLLRKVKEHMKGRNIAEKHSTYIQELYDALSAECNTLRLQLDLKDSDGKELQKRLENSLNINRKLKSTLVKLEKELSEIKICKKCVDCDTLKKREMELENLVTNYEKYQITTSIDLKEKEELIQILQVQNSRLELEIISKDSECKDNVVIIEKYSQENKKLSAKLNDLEAQLIVSSEKSSNTYLKEELISVKNSAHNENVLLREKNSQLVEQIKHLDSYLQRKSEEVDELNLRKQQFEKRRVEKEQNTQNLIISLKNQLRSFKNDIDVMKNEKFFLQRLCNDLKIALKTQVNHNKALKDFLDKLSKARENNDYKPSALCNFPSPMKYNDIYVDKLLQDNRMPFQDKPFCDIQECLNTLRQEILFLQKQIVEKNVA